jgi:beta-lactamase class D
VYRYLLLTLFLLPSLVFAEGRQWKERPEWASEFADRGVSGSIVVFDERAQAWHVFDRERAQARYSPASTFKLFNALVALETGTVKEEHEVIRWDGVKRTFDDWNRDHSLASGMKYSVVWYYQDMARRIGPQRMQDWLDRVGYGNRNIGGGIDRFWLDGDLRISQVEQVRFLQRLASGSLPFRPDVQEAEQQLVAANAEIGVARSAYFPSISLTGFAGVQSTALSSLFTGAGGIWGGAASLVQPIFTAGRTKSQVAVAEARREQAGKLINHGLKNSSAL